MTIRSAEPSDEANVIALWQECGLIVSYNNPSSDFLFAHAGASSDVLVGLDDNSNVIASVMVGHDGHRGWLYYVATSPSVRGTGWGKKIVNAGEDWLRKRGVDKVQLLVRQNNAQVVNFYEHLEFEVAPRIVMTKWLSRRT